MTKVSSSPNDNAPSRSWTQRFSDWIARMIERHLPLGYGDMMVADMVENPKYGRLRDSIFAAFSTIRIEYTILRFYPKVRVSGLLTYNERYDLFNGLYIATNRMNGVWILGFYALAATGTMLFPDVYHIDFFGGLIAGFVIMFLLMAYRDGWTSRPKKNQSLSISQSAYENEVKSWRTVLFVGICGQKRSPGRVAVQVLMFLMVAVPPVYALVQWALGRPLARETTLLEVLLRLILGGILLALWFFLKAANKVVYDILGKEIDREK